MNNNVVIAQSGGPTPVINNSLRGIIDCCRSMPQRFGTLYAGSHGIEGVLKEKLLNLSAQSADEIALLGTTPAAGSIGTCRYKLKKNQTEDFERVIEVFKAHKIGYFFYIGGNDSMDTANKISELAQIRGLELVTVGVPKTIDNDVGDSAFQLIDHTPGYGSVARYWALNVQNANQENAGSSPSDPVLVLQAMGRKIGYIPAAARLADPLREMPLQIYLAESGLTLEAMPDLVNDELKRSKRCIVVVSEGFPVGDLGIRKDDFGHTMFSASQTTVGQRVVNYLNEIGLKTRGSARLNTPGTDQRHNMIYASTVDLEESYQLGQQAVMIAIERGNGFMSTILRQAGEVYAVRYDAVALNQVANSERHFPQDWLSDNKIDVRDSFLSYAKPLIGQHWVSVPLINGLQRFARLAPIFATQKLPVYTPQAYRT